MKERCVELFSDKNMVNEMNKDCKDDSPVGTKPYIIRAIYEWSMDHHLTAQILVNTDYEGVDVPEQYIENSRIILNIHPNAVDQLEIGNFEITFVARFLGKSVRVIIPVASVMAIYGRENGQGVVFEQEPQAESERERSIDENFVDKDTEKGSSTEGPHLKLVK